MTIYLKMSYALAFFLLSTFCFHYSFSQTCTATGSGTWKGSGTKATWSCAGGATSPNDATEVIIPSGITVTINNEQTWNANVIVDGGTLIFSHKLNLGTELGCGLTLKVINGGLIDDSSSPGANERLVICTRVVITSQSTATPPAQNWPDGGFSNTGFTENGEDNSILPIELLSFKAVARQNSIDLHWQTATELNNDYFTIERSKNGIDYSSITTVEGYGTTNELQSYEFTDEHPFSGLSYYRLKQTDFDGTTETFRPVSVLFEGVVSSVSIFPNLLRTNQLNVAINGVDCNTDFTLIIFNISGTKVYEQTVSFSSSGLQKFDLSFLPKGAYVVSLSNDRISENLKLVKE